MPKPKWDVATHGPPPAGSADAYEVINSSGKPPVVHRPAASEEVVVPDLATPEAGTTPTTGVTVETEREPDEPSQAEQDAGEGKHNPVPQSDETNTGADEDE